MQNLKLKIKLLIIFCGDMLTLRFFKFSKPEKEKSNFPHFISIEQKIKPSATFENKIFNLKYAAKKINQHILKPNQIFSFWQIVGNPNRNLKKSRSIRNGKIADEVGGGLCQISGIVYYISILTGLEIVERHNHSIDIYQEHERFTPLGTDATVVYGNRDLRIKNNFDFSIKFEIEIKENQLIIKLLSSNKISAKNLIFAEKTDDDYKIVEVFDNRNRLINRSKYLKSSF
jgi:vancomycin resistance protein VanW